MTSYFEGVVFGALVTMCIYAIQPTAPTWVLLIIYCLASSTGVSFFYNMEH